MMTITYHQEPGWLTRVGMWWDRRTGKVQEVSEPSPVHPTIEGAKHFIEQHNQRLAQDGKRQIVETLPDDVLVLCPCGCNRRFAPKRRNQKYYEGNCRKRVWARKAQRKGN
jgi:hypothetical protein